MARLTEHGLRRSAGVPGLFATAYGNVGSSIYYALGLVAAHALVLTPSLLVHQVHLGHVPSWKELIFALSLAMLAYTGIETVANMAEESTDPGRQIPRAVNLVVLAVLAVYAGISVVALSALPVVHHGVGYSVQLKAHFSSPGYSTSLGGFFENDPMLGVIEHLGLHGTALTLAKY